MRFAALTMLLLFGGARAQTTSAPPWAAWSSPTALAGLDAAAVPVERSSFCGDNCRYDRSGGDATATNPQPDRWLYLDANGDAVIYDDPGAGIVTRLWLTSGGPQPTCLDTALRVKLYFGNATSAALDVPLRQLFDGSLAPFLPPLVFDPASGSGGYTSYVPIRYAHGLRIALAGLDLPGPCSTDTPPAPPRLWYQIDAQRLPPGTLTADFALTDRFPGLLAFLSAEGSDPWTRGLPPQAASQMVGPLTQWTFASDNGSGWIGGLRVKVDPAAWASLTLDITIDGDTATSLPLSRLTAVDPGDPLPPRSPLMGLDAAGWLYLWWPLPYRHGFQLTLRDAGLAGSFPVSVETVLDPAPVPLNAGHWFARRHAACSPGTNHQQTLLALPGRGKLLALAGRYAHDGGIDARYLEGDTRLRFDGQIAPAWQGSGLEDFYNGGFYFDWGRAYRQPWSGASVVDTAGSSAMWRLLLADAPGFDNGIEVLQEAGASPAEALSVCMDTVAYGYRTDARALVPVATLELGDPVAVARYAWQAAAGAQCGPLVAHYADAAATARTATVCRSNAGASQFHVELADPSTVLHLRRVVDAAAPGQAAAIYLNNTRAGYFPPLRPDSARRWQEQDAPLTLATPASSLDIRIQPLWGTHGDAGQFTESRYVLLAEPGDHIFADGFE